VAVNATRQFSATVAGTPNPSVTWDVNGVGGGNSVVGWISPAGLYTAPNAVPSPAGVAVRAVSAVMASASGTGAITVTPAPPSVTISISPASATVRLGRRLQFSAAVSGSANEGVVWKVNGIPGGNSAVGTVNTSGLYRAPLWLVPANPVTVTAASAASPSASANAAVTLRR
jgi:hypothetical protein